MATVNQAERWTRNGLRVQPRDPRRDFHVAFHELMGRGLQRSRLRLGPALPQPHQIAQHAREARPRGPTGPTSNKNQRESKAEPTTTQRKSLQILRIRHRQDQVKSQLQPPIGRLKTILNIPITLCPYLAPCNPST